jgi:hypothetical protein
MFPELQDYGLIFVSLAVFGFIILDIFKTGQYRGIPNFYRTNVEKFFHYVSTAILALSFILGFIGLCLTAPNQENAIAEFVKGFFNIFDKIHEFGIISDEGYSIAIKIFVLALLFSIIYISLYVIIFYMGMYYRVIRTIQINVFLRNRSEPIEFASLVTESDDFLFFLKKEGFNLWEAIRKDDITRIDVIKVDSTLASWIMNVVNWVISLKK